VGLAGSGVRKGEKFLSAVKGSVKWVIKAKSLNRCSAGRKLKLGPRTTRPRDYRTGTLNQKSRKAAGVETANGR
jgi:hypothetical protein